MARPDDFPPDMLATLEVLVEDCAIRDQTAQNSKQFHDTIGSEDVRINYRLGIDVMYVKKKPVLHMVCEGN